MPAAGGVARVLIDTPLPQLDHLFDYRIPEELSASAQPGVRVRVPFRSAGRLVDGYLVERSDTAEHGGRLSTLDTVVSEVPVLTPEVWRLARAIADRQAGSAIDVLRLALPPRQVRVEKAWLAARVQEPGAGGAKSDDTAEVGDVPLSALKQYRGLTDGIGGGKRLALTASPRLEQLATGEWVGEWSVTLAAAAVAALASETSAIIAVPDYRDQEQLMRALARVLPPDVIVQLDARQPNADRYRSFLRCLEPRPAVIVGNRSVLYAPATRLGLLAVWDDGDPLYAEPLAPYAHARDVALLRQHQQGGALLLAAHARSAETQRLVEVGWLHEVKPERAITPRVIPTAEQSPSETAHARIPSAAWKQARDGLAHGPVLVQVARPGYIPAVACTTCHKRAACARCGGPLGLAAASRSPSCGWCGALATGWACPHCSGRSLRSVTIGAGRTAEELGRAFPGARVVVADGEHPVTTIDSRPALVIATRGAEPVAEGGYQAVLLLDGERMMARESLGTALDCVRWWSNAAALAAPGAPVVLVGVGGEPARAVASWRQDALASAELADRRDLRFPPAVRLASVTGPPTAVQAALEKLGSEAVLDVLGPVPVGDGLVRAIVRFGYDAGAEVAARLRGAVIEQASAARAARKPKGEPRRTPTLRVRFDDPEVL